MIELSTNSTSKIVKGVTVQERPAYVIFLPFSNKQSADKFIDAVSESELNKHYQSNIQLSVDDNEKYVMVKYLTFLPSLSIEQFKERISDILNETFPGLNLDKGISIMQR